MYKVKIPLKLALRLLTTNKQFLLYNLDSSESKIIDYRLTNKYQLTGNNRDYSNYKVISCVTKQLTYINF
jgi:hypothetical protein